MYSKNYQSTSEKYPNYTSLRRTPELQHKSYSFKDPLFQSFGNGYPSRTQLPDQQKIPYSNAIPSINQNYEEAQLLQEAVEIAQKFSLMKTMLKISKPILSVSALLVNTQNKVKTQMIVHSKSKNEDQESKILCENANKYLHFIETLKKEQSKYPIMQKNFKMSENDVKIHLESRIQSRTLPFYSQGRLLLDTNQNSKDFSSKDKSLPSQQFFKPSIKNETSIENQQNSSFLHGNDQSINQDYSKYLTSDRKESYFTSNQQNTDHMFQRIQTPKISQSFTNKQPCFTPFQDSHLSRMKNDQKIERKKYRKFEKQPEYILKRKSKDQKLNLIHNQKMHKQLRIEPNEYSKDSRLNRKEIDKSSSSKGQVLVSQFNTKQPQKGIFKAGKQKMNIRKDLKKQQESKNLAFKVLDKTNQFDKMLKMTSSRMNLS